MQLNIGTRQYRTKPKQFASINNDVIGNIVDLSLEEIIDRVGNKGYTFTRAIMRGARTKENFIKQRFLVLDFDEGMSEEKFKRRCTELRLSYVFMYRTLSWSKTEERFRAVFLMENWIENSQVAYIINDMLYRIFPESDKSCRDITKLFLGGKKVVDINLEARINVAELAKAVHSYYKLTKPSNYVRDLEKIATDWGIKTVDGWFCIYDVKDFKQEELDKIDNKIIDNDVLVILADKEKLKYNSTINEIVKTVKTRKLPNLQVLTSYNTESLCKLCPLLREFVEGTDIHHDLKWKLSVKGADEADVVALSDEEIKLFEQEATELHANGHEKYPAGMYCLLLLHTGMRVGEMIALRWRDWKGDYLVIEKSVSTAKNRNKKSEDENNYISLEGSTKNQKARNIQLNREAKYILWKLKHSRESCEQDDLIVPTKTGKMNTASNLEHRMKVIMKNAGLEDVKGGLHIFRKTFATKMYENGARVEEIAAYIGDLPSTTQKYYIAIRRKVVADGETHQIVKLPGSKAGEEPVA